MASCNDCICSEVCYYKAFNDERILKKRRDDVEKICKSFVRRDSLKNTATADAVEVVRCRDCKHRYSDSWCEYVDYDDNFYCARGERKGGDGNG